MTYTVIGTQRSRTFRVLWMLEELGAPYTLEQTMPQSDGARAANPTGKIPALRTEEGVLTDSTAILTFLADRHGALTAAPGSVERARQDALSFRILDEIEAPLWAIARHSFVLPEDRREPAVRDSLGWECAQHLARLAQDFGPGPFLMGAELRLPDVILGHCLDWAAYGGIPLPDGPLADYRARLHARPAHQRARAR